MKTELTLLDLFSGIGGFSLAARWAGIETVQFVEIDIFCQKVLVKNFPNVSILSDIRDFTLLVGQHVGHQVDIITAGFPCQPFSIGGKKKGSKDDRYLWPETIRVIRASKPRWILLENVSGIISWLDPILEDLETEGYTWWAYLIAASSIGAPHKRERLWIVANTNDVGCNNGFDNAEKCRIQNDFQRNLQDLQKEWSQCQPDTWKTLNAEDWIEYNSKLSGRDDGLSNRVDRIKAVGNSIVPQIAYMFLSIIAGIEEYGRERETNQANPQR